VLSRAFVDIAASPTCSFHLGERICTIDVEMPKPDPAAIRTVEDRANEIVFADRPVAVRELAVDDPAAGAAPDPALSGLALKPGDPIRIIDFEGFDSTPCGGTHVARSGQIGLVAVSGWETYKGMTRISFVCGGRAAARLRDLNDVVSMCAGRLSARAEELPVLLEKVIAERDDLRKRQRDLKADLARHEAEAAASTAPSVGGLRLLRRTFTTSECDVDAAQALARSFVAAPGRVALLAVIESGQGTLLAARSAVASQDAASETPRIGEVIAEVARSVGGRGGGSATFGRAGGIPAARVEEILDAAIARLGAGGPSSRP
jgi:alanyl-tRNA synthetase